ncbi:MAG: penicillin acylase family protein [Candidatus Eremiobacteraeota bacterium]|nr:penicillin acylase family protein [Candidatus Eremiobacteraeota bacterium]
MKLVAALGLLLALGTGPADPAMARWQREAADVTIVRDDWGIAHVHGTSDADAVFGAIYAQAEDDFNRVETNYLTALGRNAEYDGEKSIYADLRAKLYADPVKLQALYAQSPASLRKLMDAWADGLNYFLATHPNVHPKVLRHFEPWMALSFTEGSIGGDIEDISLDGLRAFYGGGRAVAFQKRSEERMRDIGSNGIALAPAMTENGHALLLINPHTSFYFRSEFGMRSDEGLNAFGAATWGQFFLYQGFNENAGWMHSSTGVNNVDFFAETIVRQNGRLFYRYGSELRNVGVSRIVVPYRTAHGSLDERTFTIYRTHHGPIVAKEGSKWIAVALMDKPIAALSQSFYRTKATDLTSFLAIADRYKANSSNNTVFADRKGEIAFLTPQFVPRRDDRFDYTHPVDGSNPATDWHGLLPMSAMPDVVNPPNGWVFNSNDWPYSSAGSHSPRRSAYPRYMDTVGENFRGVHATRLLTGHRNFTLDSLVTAAFDPYLPAFAELIPRLLAAYDALPGTDPRAASLRAPIATLRAWDDRWSATSIPTTVAVYWGDALLAAVKRSDDELPVTYARMLYASANRQLAALSRATARLNRDFGTWRTPWGEVNRFQRLNDAIVAHFDDAKPSIPVPFTSGFWGSLAAFYTKQTQTKRRYGVDGNSFVAVVEFDDRVRARAVTAGGESGDPASPHFTDQVVPYSMGHLRDVYFYDDELAPHTVRTYHP